MTMRDAVIFLGASVFYLMLCVGTAYWIGNVLTWPWNAPAVLLLPLAGLAWVFTVKFLDENLPEF